MPFAQFGQEVTIAPGSIIMWGGAVSSIPAGWALCDGNNATPDLTGRFIKSIADAGTDPGATGGSANITLTDADLPSHSHSGGTSEDAVHTHQLRGYSSTYDYMDDWDDDDWHYGFRSGSDEAWSGPAGGHGHSITLQPDGAASPTPYPNEPRYYELAFLMKL